MAKVKVTLMNEWGAMLNVTDVEPTQLPETFSAETKVRIGGDEWLVLSAKPLTAKEFTKTGELTLVIKKAETGNPKHLLFSMPTLAHSLPKFAGGLPPEGYLLDIHEDMWRQNEFLNCSSESAAQEELQAIRNIWEHYAVKGENYTAFSKCYIRTFGEPGLDINIHEVISLLRSENPVQLTINNMPVLNGFGLRADSGLFYGIAENDRISVLCSETSDMDVIHLLMKSFNLLFMDWCGCMATLHK